MSDGAVTEPIIKLPRVRRDAGMVLITSVITAVLTGGGLRVFMPVESRGDITTDPAYAALRGEVQTLKVGVVGDIASIDDKLGDVRRRLEVIEKSLDEMKGLLYRHLGGAGEISKANGSTGD